jgi:hypothetical protein
VSIRVRGNLVCGAGPHVLGLQRFVPDSCSVGRERCEGDVDGAVLTGGVSCGIHLVVIHLVGVEVDALLASLGVVFLVLGFGTTESVSFASRHQVPAHEC